MPHKPSNQTAIAQQIEILEGTEQPDALSAANCAEVNRRLDAAGVPDAKYVACDDPECNSRICHRVTTLIEERDRLLAALESKPVIERSTESVAPDNFEKFVAYHKLKLVVKEFVGTESPRVRAWLADLECDSKHVEVSERSMLSGVSGWAATEADAIERLKREIAGKQLAIGSWGRDPGRRFWAPSEWK